MIRRCLQRGFRVKSWRDDEYLREAQRQAERTNPEKGVGEEIEEVVEDAMEKVDDVAGEIKDKIAQSGPVKKAGEAMVKVATKLDQAI